MDNKDLIKIFPSRKIYNLVNMAHKLNIHKDYSSDYFIQKHEDNKKDAIIALKNFANELGRTPLGQEITDNKDMPGIVTYIRYFGGYREACIKAGLEPNSNSIYNKKIYPIIISEPLEFKSSWSFTTDDYLNFYKDKFNFDFLTTDFKKGWEKDICIQLLELDKNVNV